jgi:hypothetical protein
MEAMRQTWTDDRMDDLAGRVDAGFAWVDKQFEKVDERFLRLEAKIEAARIENAELFEKQWEKTVMLLDAQRAENQGLSKQ